MWKQGCCSVRKTFTGIVFGIKKNVEQEEKYLQKTYPYLAGLWIRIHFLQILYQLLFSMRIWILLYKTAVWLFCKTICKSGTFWMSFLWLDPISTNNKFFDPLFSWCCFLNWKKFSFLKKFIRFSVFFQFSSPDPHSDLGSRRKIYHPEPQPCFLGLTFLFVQL